MRGFARWCGVAVLLVFALFPAYWMVSTAVDPRAATRGGSLLPSGVSAEHFTRVLSGAGFGRYLVNSALVAVVTVAVSSFVALLAAVAVARFRFRMRTTVMVMILVAQMVPLEALVIPLFLQARNLAALNSLLGLSIVYLAFSLPFAVWQLRGFVAAVPVEIEESAQVDGCSWWQSFWRVLVPMVAPGLVATSVFSFITAWNEFIFALTFLQDQRKYTVAIGLQKFFGENTADWGPIMAASTLLAVPVVVFFMIVQRHLVAGVTSGAVKG
ncbi:carbohydrate ABC transporter membrane protein 2, CUT1 family [Austwickia chelonae]|uniref:Putative sugar ABC transporter permease protein n=2 Tax=Austwickia TaxID=1184606 RepID=K6UNV3_9MICO|nr:putative sugar ABC transporter permease protein [Austwickia chelonae NBRC 105200]SEW37891.1 carbohydrate ABC transporter membrane protein 2, CUT1 family [Austwickia chelonae]